MQRVGPFPQAYIGLDQFPLHEHNDRMLEFSPQTLQDIDAKHAPKPLQATWSSKPEAGDFVEITSQGGIIGFDSIEMIGKFQLLRVLQSSHFTACTATMQTQIRSTNLTTRTFSTCSLGGHYVSYHLQGRLPSSGLRLRLSAS